MQEWNAAQYLRFERERTQPAADLAARIDVADPKKIIDIGCGPGNSTRVLKKRFPAAQVLGADKSPHMVEEAKKSCPGIDFMVCDAKSELKKAGGGYDIVFSNACIQWIPGHPRLLREMMGMLKEGGVLAVQTPMQMREPIHLIIDEVSQSEKWRGKLSGGRLFYNLPREEYFDLLCGISAEFFMWETAYCHRLPSREAILDWYRGTGLRPYLARLTKEEQKEFEEDILKRIKEEYPLRVGGVLFPFPRLFFTAVR